jgi:hypothetical protein
MLDEAALASNILSFVQKNFGFSQLARVGEHEYAVFQRTETESEAKFRPRLIELFLVVPLEWIRLDEEKDSLEIRIGSTVEESGTPGTAQDIEHEKPEFAAHGATWTRVKVADARWAYLPSERFQGRAAASAIATLGISP